MKTHGLSRTPEYSTWQSMIARCHRETSTGYHKYGARGIRVCERWRSFENFLADIGSASFADPLSGSCRCQRELRARELPLGDVDRAGAQ